MVKLLLLLVMFQSSLALAVIEDNSFLLEEAYNQERGAYQFIQTYAFTKNDNYLYNLSAEIPLSDKVHQLSFDLTSLKFDRGVEQRNEIKVNYRWQPINTESFLLADRLGLIAPIAEGSYGVENVLATTWKMHPLWMNHWNVGYRIHPDKNAARIGGSVIYLASDKFNLLLEAILRDEEATTLHINPGMRFDLSGRSQDLQIVPGISFPVQVLEGREDLGILVYFSAETDNNL